ncbi:hypothetical protein Vafri_13939, partial [Volvox africanus]
MWASGAAENEEHMYDVYDVRRHHRYTDKHNFACIMWTSSCCYIQRRKASGRLLPQLACMRSQSSQSILCACEAVSCRMPDTPRKTFRGTSLDFAFAAAAAATAVAARRKGWIRRSLERWRRLFHALIEEP